MTPRVTLNLLIVLVKISIEDGVGADRAHGQQVAAGKDDQHVAAGGGGVHLEQDISFS